MFFKSFKKKIFRLFMPQVQEVDALYKILYNQVHDLDKPLELCNYETKAAFDYQWRELPEGKFLLSDPKFKNSVEDILAHEEIQIKKEWFKGKKILDAGCGNGRWAYGFAKLGAELTCVDINESALNETEKAMRDIRHSATFVQSSLENIDKHLQSGSYDLVFSWGVVHHCVSYNTSLKNICSMVKDGGVIYLYLYGRKSLSIEQDLELFKKRVAYNVLMNKEDRYKFLLKKSNGDKNLVHVMHDNFAPLINRRFEFEEVEAQLKKLGFSNIVRTIDHTEVFIRAIKGEANINHIPFLEKKLEPYWFQR